MKCSGWLVLLGRWRVAVRTPGGARCLGRMSRNAQCFTNSSNPCAEMVTLADSWQNGTDGNATIGPYGDLGGILPAGQNSICKGAPMGGWYVCAYGPLELTACHGYCTDYLECSTTDIILETDYVYTI
eukprot:COSAG02_NODE_1465_length_12485_cov_9.526804_17_plen_127_part_01